MKRSILPRGKKNPAFDWIQVEITSHCNARCIYCPHTVFKDRWQKKHLPFETFQRLLPALKGCSFVHLQGWGEPLLHPDFFRIFKSAKDTGCQVGTTTNGTLITDSLAGELVDVGLDILGFSLAGCGPRNDTIRKGTTLVKTLRALEKVNRAKAMKNSGFPKIHVAYMLFRSMLQDLSGLPSVLGDVGVDEVVVNSLSLVLLPSFCEEAFLSTSKGEFAEIKALMDETAKDFEKKGIAVYFNLFNPFTKPGMCPENVERALLVGSGGKVSPCVMGNIPVSGAVSTYNADMHKCDTAHLQFGDLNDNSIQEIWRTPAYRSFRKDMARGRLKGPCITCLKPRLKNHRIKRSFWESPFWSASDQASL